MLEILFLGNVLFAQGEDFQREQNLAGTWQVTYDHGKQSTIQLPGTLTDAGLGNLCPLQPSMQKEVFLNLKAKYGYVGEATYSRKVFVPRGWKNSRIILHFDRTLWTSYVKVNNKKVEGMGESLSVPHEFDITDAIVLGKENLLEIVIDNSKKYEISYNDLAHSYTNETQTKWNGILGKIVLQAKPKNFIRNVAVYPHAQNGTLGVRVDMTSHDKMQGKLRLLITSPQGKLVKDTMMVVKNAHVAFATQVKDALLWDEFSPQVYRARVEYTDKKQKDEKLVLFGFRDLSNEQALLHINKRRLFLRGTLENCVFPLKGYPAMDEKDWRLIFEKAKEYGLNHLRFHSWCPPEAAFAVADKMGFYLQIELPVWSLDIGKDKSTLDFLYAEADRILETYGNHPSFCFLSLGNELQGDFKALDDLLTHVKEDSRRLYTTTSFTFEKGHGDWPEPHDDYWVSQWSRKGWLRGQGVFEEQPVSFRQDYSSAIDSLPVPVVTHEIGQYSVYPDVSSIKKFTGNLLPLNLQSVKEELQRKGRLGLAQNYHSASTRFASLLYKEEIERALKTPGYSGFQLLGLTDYPGQGTALVGLLDVFWEGKDDGSSTCFKQACAPIVPLAYFDKGTYLNNEQFKASFKVANFTARTLENAVLAWKLSREDGIVVAEGRLKGADIQVGNQQELGGIQVPLSMLDKAEHLNLSVEIVNTNIRNQWDIWVYPAQLEISRGNVVVTDDIAQAAIALKRGRSVLLNLPYDKIAGVEGKFLPVFWSPVHFPNQPGTMGVLCNPSHPSLRFFPTEEHSNWQWWDLCKHATTMQLDSIEKHVNVLIGMIDNFYKNRSLGLVFETKVGNGKLIVSSIDMNQLEGRPVARQLKYSLLNYMNSSQFNPKESLDFETLKSCIYNGQLRITSKKSIYELAE